MLPARFTITHVRAGDDAIVVGGDSEIRVLDAASGRLRWRRDGAVGGILVGRDVVYGTAGGALVSRRSSDGRLNWKRDGACPAPPEYAKNLSSPTIVVRYGDDLIAGCWGGDMVRISAASGSVRARSRSAFAVTKVDSIRPLGRCALAVAGTTDGAHLVSQSAIVDCKQLRAIVPQGSDLSVLGAIGNTAVLDDLCCNGRPDVYQPATIILANLATGKESPAVDLRPEPDRYPANHRPLGQGSAAMLDGNELYLVVDRTVYRYGDPRSLLSSPQRIPGELVDFPVLLRHGLLALRVQVAGGAVEDQVVRIRNGAIEALWRRPETGAVVIGYDASEMPDVVRFDTMNGPNMTQTLVRTTDGGELQVPCAPAAVARGLVVSICNTQTLVGNRYLQYVAAYRWPEPQRPQSTAAARTPSG
ncbi:MAG: PQQ-binding-like beta-propeller repeat protein [Candidatus Eremiobacteraeota bacterium]|nr:PQQ-binding-like beta-propeller repeat protein [Candidatus Eremiobacteraeota bacterium]